MNNILFIFQTANILLKYFLNHMICKSKMDCFTKMIKELGNLNIFYIKLFQSLSTNIQLLNHDQIMYLSSYTDNVPYTDDELDFSFIETSREISEKLNHTFEIDKVDNKIIPYRSGMIAVVYTGKINGEKVIIKVIRKKVVDKLNDALKNINFLINIISYLPCFNILNIHDLVEENKNLLFSQTDFIIETTNI